MRNRNLALQATLSTFGIIFATLAILLNGSLSLVLIGLSVVSFIAALGVACPDYGAGQHESGSGS